MRINSKEDLRRLVGRELEKYECDHYGYDDHEEFIDIVTECYLEELEDKKDFEWGNMIIGDKDLWEEALRQSDRGRD